MLQYLLLLIISSAIADNCSYIYDQQYYTRSSILTIKGLPTNLVFNPNNKDLHFTLIDLDSLQNDEIQTRMDQYILRDGVPIKIENVNGQAAAVDARNNKVYIASDDGLNILNSSDKANFFSLKDEDIVQLSKPPTGDDIYAVIYPENHIYALNLKKNEKKKIENVPCALIVAVDADKNIFYECDSKYVKVLLSGFQEPVQFVGIAQGVARAFAVDNNNKVILAANDGLYHLTPNNLIPKKLMDLDFIPSGIAFDDDDNMYIATNEIIYKYNDELCVA